MYMKNERMYIFHLAPDKLTARKHANNTVRSCTHRKSSWGVRMLVSGKTGSILYLLSFLCHRRAVSFSAHSITIVPKRALPAPYPPVLTNQCARLHDPCWSEESRRYRWGSPHGYDHPNPTLSCVVSCSFPGMSHFYAEKALSDSFHPEEEHFDIDGKEEDKQCEQHGHSYIGSLDRICEINNFPY